MRRLIAALACLMVICPPLAAAAETDIVFDEPDAVTDALVDRCLHQRGVDMLEGTDVICYNAAIFPEQFLKLNELPAASRIIITSPGGNVATARGMSTILDQRAEPVVIAGPCLSACAMVILPGLDDVHIHHTAHIASHGIVMMPFKPWWGWLRDDRAPNALSTARAQMGYDFGFMMHSSGTTHMKAHLEGQGVDIGFIQDISDSMEADARAYKGCRVDPDQYWGIMGPEHLKTYLGPAITRMEKFVSSWDDPVNAPYQHIGVPVSSMTYIMKPDYEKAGCDGSSDG